MELAAASRHTSIHAELCGYLRRAGHHVPAPPEVPGPWRLALTGRWREAADAWHALGERYEQAVEQARQRDDEGARAAGLAILTGLGATATLTRLDAQSG
jgi:hypothetical protein